MKLTLYILYILGKVFAFFLLSVLLLPSQYFLINRFYILLAPLHCPIQLYYPLHIILGLLIYILSSILVPSIYLVLTRSLF